MAKQSREFLQGLMTAAVEVASITGKQPMDGMTDREWKLISDLNRSMIGLANAEAKRLEANT